MVVTTPCYYYLLYQLGTGGAYTEGTAYTKCLPIAMGTWKQTNGPSMRKNIGLWAHEILPHIFTIATCTNELETLCNLQIFNTFY